MGSFGRRFRECRKMAGLKQVAAAKAIGVSQSPSTEPTCGDAERFRGWRLL